MSGKAVELIRESSTKPCARCGRATRLTRASGGARVCWDCLDGEAGGAYASVSITTAKGRPGGARERPGAASAPAPAPAPPTAPARGFDKTAYNRLWAKAKANGPEALLAFKAAWKAGDMEAARAATVPAEA